MRVIDRFPTFEDLQAASAEEIGAAIVDHIKGLGSKNRRISVHPITNSLDVGGHYHNLDEPLYFSRKASSGRVVPCC
jgi:hypothetical protein